jgi:hypothetical protein
MAGSMASAGDLDALLHPARELSRELLAVVPEADQAQVALHDRGAPGAVHALQAQPEADVGLGGEPREEGGVGILEEHDPVAAGPRDRRAVEREVARRGRFEAGDDVEEGGLAAAAGAQETEEFALADLEIDPGEDADRLPAAAQRKALFQTANHQHDQALRA